MNGSHEHAARLILKQLWQLWVFRIQVIFDAQKEEVRIRFRNDH